MMFETIKRFWDWLKSLFSKEEVDIPQDFFGDYPNRSDGAVSAEAKPIQRDIRELKQMGVWPRPEELRAPEGVASISVFGEQPDFKDNLERSYENGILSYEEAEAIFIGMFKTEAIREAEQRGLEYRVFSDENLSELGRDTSVRADRINFIMNGGEVEKIILQ